MHNQPAKLVANLGDGSREHVGVLKGDHRGVSQCGVVGPIVLA
jgi:hypothetical protein